MSIGCSATAFRLYSISPGSARKRGNRKGDAREFALRPLRFNQVKINSAWMVSAPQPQVPPVPIGLDTGRNPFRRCEVGEKVISLLAVGPAHLLECRLSHDAFLQIG